MSFVRNRYRDGCAWDFDRTLQELKRHGCILLITGAVAEDVTLQATRRKHVLVATRRSDVDIADGLPPGVKRDGPNVRVIRPSTVELDDSPTNVGQTELEYIRAELLKAVGYFDDSASGLSPAELRVSIDSIEGLLETNDHTTVTQFLRTMMALVRGVNGIGHVHLPVPDDSRTVDRLSPLFDARIELRRRDRLVAEQRWHMLIGDSTTPWAKL
jgi:hypothetical protein